jgi:bifunctional non-homologous end joining protein LigD
MERFPNGIDGERVFQKEVPKYFPEWIQRVTVPKAKGTVRHPLCQDAPTLVYLANQACITPHVWLSRVDRMGLPDQMIMDLDPSTDFEQARLAALSTRELLDELGLPSFVKTTGSKGLHVTVPLDRRSDVDTVKQFARDVAEVLARREPDRLTTEFRKAERDGRLFLDVMRNGYAQTAVPPFAVRPRPGAPVATPLEWSELDHGGWTSDRWTIRTLFDRVEAMPDPWGDLRRRAKGLKEARRRLDRLLAQA